MLTWIGFDGSGVLAMLVSFVVALGFGLAFLLLNMPTVLAIVGTAIAGAGLAAAGLATALGLVPYQQLGDGVLGVYSSEELGWLGAVALIVLALGGMVVPALVYFAFNSSGAEADGWGIPMATDIAFAVGVGSGTVEFLTDLLDSLDIVGALHSTPRSEHRACAVRSLISTEKQFSCHVHGRCVSPDDWVTAITYQPHNMSNPIGIVSPPGGMRRS